jgi:glycosyltransferase involved in cell wall biosynthesis
VKISGFTFVRNALEFGYPIFESLHSLLPLTDELIIAAGAGTDDTIPYLKSINNPKLKIIETEWDDSLRQGGLIYSQQTNLALQHCTGDWCIYLQADEVLHEQDYDLLRKELQRADSNINVDALLFRYLHFYGSYDYIGTGRKWYRREIRAFRNTGKVHSWLDAQGFRKKNGEKVEKLRAIQTDVRVFHYGWVRPPKVQTRKILNAVTYYRPDAEFNPDAHVDYDFDYKSAFQLDKYKGRHPALMLPRIEQDRAWTEQFDPTRLKPKPLIMKLSDALERKTGIKVGEWKDFIEVK